jgi:bilin biosynthesis protein
MRFRQAYRHPLLWIFLGIVTVGLVLWSMQSREPTYGGKNVYQLAHSLHSPDPAQTTQATKGFQTLGSNAVPILIRMLNARDSVTSRFVWEHAGWLGNKAQRFLASKVAPPRSQSSRLASLKALTILGTNAMLAVPALEPLLMEGRQQEVFQVAHTLGTIGKDAIPVLTQGLRHTNGLVRQASGLALANVGPIAAAAIDPLVATLNDSNPHARDNAARALAAIGTNALPAIIQVLDSGDPQTTLMAVKVLRFMHPLRRLAAPPLHKLLAANPGPEVLAEALLTLGEVIAIDPTSIDTATKALKDPSPLVRRSAVTALGHFGSRASAALPDLTALLTEEPADIRKETLISLGKIGNLSADQLESVKACLADPNPAIRESATNCLNRLGLLESASIPSR